ncbi:MAG: hypothetical protein ABJ327_00240 [Litoreibacter sp.]
MIKTAAIISLFLSAGATFAGQAKIENVTARQAGGTWTFNVTIRHDDSGWDHYADAWTVNTVDGKEIGRRTLAHPHENEQPFTRSLSGVSIPEGTSKVVVRAHDSVHGWSDKTYTVKLK